MWMCYLQIVIYYLFIYLVLYFNAPPLGHRQDLCLSLFFSLYEILANITLLLCS